MSRTLDGAPWRDWALTAVLLLGVLLSGLFVPVMEIDAAQYASISMEMAQTGEWLQVQHRGTDYLDKPPLLFWLSAGLFRLVGASTWAYKLPSVLAALLAVYATGRFAARWLASAALGRAAALVLAANVSVLLHTNDVRTDTLLLGGVALALWQFGEYVHPQGRRRFATLCAGWVGVSIALLTKGPIGFMVPALAVGTHLLVRRQLGLLLRPAVWGSFALVVPLALAPMLYGLYRQFGTVGLEFYFWKQSFGRLTGENTWRDGSDGFFFVHTFLWAFLPWSWAALTGLWQRLRLLVRGGLPEGFTLGGFLLPVMALSFSSYKLPHYLMVTLPMAAVLAVAGLAPALAAAGGARRVWRGILLGQHAVLALVLGALAVWAFPASSAWVWLPVLAALGLASWWLSRPNATQSLLLGPAAGIAGVFLMLNLHLYPTLLQYQTSRTAGLRYRSLPAPQPPLIQYNGHAQALDWESRAIRTPLGTAQLDSALRQGPLWLYTDGASADSLRHAPGVRIVAADSMAAYPITRLTPRFVNPATRNRATRPYWLLLVARRTAD